MQNNTISIFYGNQVFSEFRKKNLLNKAKKIGCDIRDFTAFYLHLVESKTALSINDQSHLNQLLDYGVKNKTKPYTQKFFIAPRVGTISPWSSRATNIAQQCDVNILRLERCVAITFDLTEELSASKKNELIQIFFDRMTESVFFNETELKQLFRHADPKSLEQINLLEHGVQALEKFNQDNGLALSDDEIAYLFNYYRAINRNATDAELMMFAQANSEHCRHKIFNASWQIDGIVQNKSLFEMIKNTHQLAPQKTIVAYSDNSSIIEGQVISRFYPDQTGNYAEHVELTHYLMKVETHNHPTAISPFAGAATGSGGEIRDEGATGRGSKPKAGLTGFSVSNLKIPGYLQTWENSGIGKPARIASALQIMIDGPIGAASYNNEFGRPNILGYFRTLEIKYNEKYFGYHKPIMLAGGVGNIADQHTHKKSLEENDLLIQLGGPAMLIGLGGGAASSMQTGANLENLDFDSVQRGNPELQRRAQEVIDRCWQMADKNPILSIHDVGAGGLSNAFPELVHDGGVGAIFELREINNEEFGMSPKEIWCNEAQERYVLAIKKTNIDLFEQICQRERCPYAVVGRATKEKKLVVTDSFFKNDVVKMDLDILLGKPPKTKKEISLPKKATINLSLEEKNLADHVERVLRFPAVANKSFLITIGDRSVTGLISRDQFVGPWQVPVSDVAITKSDFISNKGEAFSVGEKAPLAIINAVASAKMAVGEAITNIVASPIEDLSHIKLSANWMAAAGQNENDYELYAAVRSIGMELCPDLQISIPVGKDSLSMQTKWKEVNDDITISSPLSLIISAFAECTNTRKVLTPQLERDANTSLLLIDLGQARNRMGGSAFLLTQNLVGQECPDVDNAQILKQFFKAVQQLNADNKILAYHDRSDGGLITTLLEMAFAGHCGIEFNLERCEIDDTNAFLFNEELGAVIQVKDEESDEIKKILEQDYELNVCFVGKPKLDHSINIKHGENMLFASTRRKLQSIWSETSFHIQALRDNPKTAQEEFENILDDNNPGINPKITFDIVKAPLVKKNKPKIAILREQGVNGQNEMAAAFYYAGFECRDVHMTDLINKKIQLDSFQALVACGGFSYGDVLGAGQGWAKSILFNEFLKDQFYNFFNRDNTLSLGVCNGCQMLSSIKELIPGANYWPKFVKNESEQFEARFVNVRVENSNSLFFNEMHGSVLPIAVAHGEGRVEFDTNKDLEHLCENKQITLSYVDNKHEGTLRYPFNPNGSINGITGITSTDGRISIMMPHPERVFVTDQNSWYPKGWSEYGPWYRIFANANKYFA